MLAAEPACWLAGWAASASGACACVCACVCVCAVCEWVWSACGGRVVVKWTEERGNRKTAYITTEGSIPDISSFEQWINISHSLVQFPNFSLAPPLQLHVQQQRLPRYPSIFTVLFIIHLHRPSDPPSSIQLPPSLPVVAALTAVIGCCTVHRLDGISLLGYRDFCWCI